ncbi:hypothetical protein D9M68_688470 [compost metagenome]
MAHQAGADQVVLHPVAGTADVQVDLVIAGFLGQLGAGRQVCRHATAQLQGQRVFRFAVAQEARVIAMQQRAGGDHLGIQQRMPRQLTQEEAAVPVSPVHHGGTGKTAGNGSRLLHRKCR